MPGLRGFVAPLVFPTPIAARLYCSFPRASTTTMGKMRNGSCSEGSGEGLAPLSANEFRIYNRMAEQMNGFVRATFLAKAPLMNTNR